MFENNIQYIVTGYIILIVLFRALFQISPIDILFFTAIPANNGASIVATEFTTIGMIGNSIKPLENSAKTSFP